MTFLDTDFTGIITWTYYFSYISFVCLTGLPSGAVLERLKSLSLLRSSLSNVRFIALVSNEWGRSRGRGSLWFVWRAYPRFEPVRF
jgi:hypothetical protein